MTDDLVMRIGEGNIFEGSDFEVRVPRAYVDEVLEALRGAGLAAEEPIEHALGDSAGVKITVALLDGGALPALANVLAAILAKHDNKRLIVNKEGVDAMGYTSKDLKQILQAIYPGGRPQDDPQIRE
ncbi:hypothetical protein [Ornithinimicrobium cerasi]|uniref:Uncharacterized protein n=1 Tax=Ornithinimicrobium cerasi TaxID=2248773 RepID=A0A285VQ60_9MICO|nr:hypothetical protein [Ornithinimicrobium cerasi]SOC56093.1 hypothetical protein SAMN05421879_106200 [Ornithinimicrobium cerasi]